MHAMIGITAGEHSDIDEVWGPSIYGQARTYVDAVVRAQGVPISIPLLEDEKILRELYEKLDGIVFSGGNDIDPNLYGSKPEVPLENVHRARDDQECLLLKWAFEDEKPILAICRGMQVLNVFAGGTLHQDISHCVPDTLNHRASDIHEDIEYIAHSLKIEENSRLSKILGGTEIKTNSRHHQAVNRIGHGLKPTAWSEDGIIEAVEIDGDHFVLGVQSHPEALEASTVKDWQKLFSAFIEASAPKKINSLQQELQEAIV